MDIEEGGEGNVIMWDESEGKTKAVLFKLYINYNNTYYLI